ncbi:hypothetical protein [Marinicrinis lubricantis]|uniref:Uncharacterized protein n=1 Tax=Marinicrinis lubricantis TaxID=2086470 RepID=A0ABW1IL56_9BACL
MIYFEKLNRLANWCFAATGLLFVMTIIFFATSQFSEIMEYNFTNDMRGSFFTVVFFVLSVFCLFLGIVLKCLVNEANGEMQLIEARLSQLEKQIS